jgi:hypothetical protein
MAARCGHNTAVMNAQRAGNRRVRPQGRPYMPPLSDFRPALWPRCGPKGRGGHPMCGGMFLWSFKDHKNMSCRHTNSPNMAAIMRPYWREFAADNLSATLLWSRNISFLANCLYNWPGTDVPDHNVWRICRHTAVFKGGDK